ncbi:hypothetical protein Dsin_008546 [Dipteronia sinensis]|uniref:Transmembrane protein n=1 Tax=Dipteronia sinensis TaxID=43782 RepID=A0AAE0ANX3_9ROSI|nr:hypothetical protein Dsin_008546 [Dipteronia sinensis]
MKKREICSSQRKQLFLGSQMCLRRRRFFCFVLKQQHQRDKTNNNRKPDKAKQENRKNHPLVRISLNTFFVVLNLLRLLLFGFVSKHHPLGSLLLVLHHCWVRRRWSVGWFLINPHEIKKLGFINLID